MKNQMKGKKGITLIALVITLIVLLILAGVTVATLTGDNGLLQKATNAKQANEEAIALETIQVEVAGCYGLDGRIDKEQLNKKLIEISGLTYNDNKLDLTDDTKKINSFPATVKLNGFKYNIDEYGKVEKYKSVLPEGFEELEYIESSGTQYIVTQLTLCENYGIDLDAIVQFDNGASYIGSSSSAAGNSESLSIVSFEWNNKPYLTYNLKRITGQDEWSGYLNSRHKFGIRQGNKVYIDGSLIKESESAYSSSISNNASIFWAKGSRFKTYGRMKLYNACFYNSNNELIGNFIPCYSNTTVNEYPSGTIGLYDTIGGKFYTNQGTGTFGYKSEDGTIVLPQQN